MNTQLSTPNLLMLSPKVIYSLSDHESFVLAFFASPINLASLIMGPESKAIFSFEQPSSRFPPQERKFDYLIL